MNPDEPWELCRLRPRMTEFGDGRAENEDP